MLTIIDTYNCVHAGSAFGGSAYGLTVRRLCEMIERYPKAQRVTLVLDGRAKPDEPSENEFPAITLKYSGTGVTADAVIAQLVEKKPRQATIVVTNDKAVQRHARANRAAVVGCETYLQTLMNLRAAQRAAKRAREPAAKSGATMSASERDAWMRAFGFDLRGTPAAAPIAAPTEEPTLTEADLHRLMGRIDPL
jgi:predicted RNA-binding protein with PIN domain